MAHRAELERYICKHPNFGISTTSRVERSHGSMKRVLTSCSGTLYAAAKKISHSDIERSQQLSAISSNENLHAEVVKKLNHQDEEGTIDECSCTVRSRYLLPCSHQIQLGLPLDVTHIHPRWRVQPIIPPLNISSQGPQPEVLSVLKDSQSVLPRNSRPRGTRRLQTSAEIIQIQKAADRIEKVKRGGSCHKVGSDTNSAQSPKLSNQRSPQGTDEGGCVLTQTTNTIAEMAENDAIDDTRGDVEAFHNHDEDDAIFEAMWADALSLL
ncbi:hypothetical protein V1523DRAFT_444888 [Lipomyces doorenjongii]